MSGDMFLGRLLSDMPLGGPPPESTRQGCQTQLLQRKVPGIKGQRCLANDVENGENTSGVRQAGRVLRLPPRHRHKKGSSSKASPPDLQLPRELASAPNIFAAAMEHA